MITVQKLTERLKLTNVHIGFILDHIRDGFRAIELETRENVETSYINIVDGVEYYDFPVNMVKFISISIDEDICSDYLDYRWSVSGRKIRLRKYNNDSELDVPDESLANAIIIRYTSAGYIFVHNPDGDNTYYNFLSSETTAVDVDEIVFVVDGHTTGSGERFHYYKCLSAITSTDLSTIDFTDTTAWEDVTEITSPDEDSYINLNDNMIDALTEYVRARLSEDREDVKMMEYRENRFMRKTDKGMHSRNDGRVFNLPPDSPFSIR